MSSLNNVSKLVCDAVAVIVRRFRASNSGEELAGLAVLVDPGFESVYGAAVTISEVDEETEFDLLVSPFDWEHEFHGGKFDEVSASIRASANAVEFSDYAEKARAVADALVDGLLAVRADGDALDRVFWIVMAADGGSEWLAIQNACIERMNGSGETERWLREYG